MVEYFRKRNGACMKKKKLSLKKFLSRKLAWGILLLSNLSLISIGFSAWNIGNVTTGEVQINVSAADIISGSIFEEINVTSFTLSADGIVQNGTIVDSGNIGVTLKVNNSLCTQGSFLGTNSELNIKTNLYCRNNTKVLSCFNSLTIDLPNSSYQKLSGDASNLNFMITIPIDSSTASTEWNFSYVFKGDMKEFVIDAPKFVFKATAVKA